MAGARFSMLLAAVALFAVVARGATVRFMNGLEANTIMDEGTSFEVKWSWDGADDAVGALVLTTFMRDNTGSIINNTIEDNLDLSKGSYAWVVKTQKGRRSLDWYYRFGINYGDGASWSSGRAFRIMTGTSTTSSPPDTSTSTNSPDKPKDHSSGAPGLSGGAIAGIVVGSVVGVGIIAALVGLVLYYRRKSRQENREAGPFTALSDVGGGYWTGNGTHSSSTSDNKDVAGFGAAAPKYQPPEELDTVNPPTVFELEGGPRIQEGHNQGQV